MIADFKPIPDFPSYGVNFKGQVCRILPGGRAKVGKLLKPCRNRKGYLYVSLGNPGDNGKRYYRSVHSLVAAVFIGPPPFHRVTIDHKNDIKQDNHFRNLEYVSNAVNNKRAYDRGRPRPWSKKNKET